MAYKAECPGDIRKQVGLDHSNTEQGQKTRCKGRANICFWKHPLAPSLCHTKQEQPQVKTALLSCWAEGPASSSTCLPNLEVKVRDRLGHKARVHKALSHLQNKDRGRGPVKEPRFRSNTVPQIVLSQIEYVKDKE